MGFRFPSKKHDKKLSALSLEVFLNSNAALWVVNKCTQRCDDVLCCCQETVVMVVVMMFVF